MEIENLKKKNKTIITILVVIFVIGICILGYYVFNKSSRNNEINKNDTEIEKEDKDKEEETEEEDINQVTKTDDQIFDEIVEIIKDELFIFYGLNSIEDLTPEIKAFLAISLYNNNKGLDEYIENNTPLKSEDLKEEFNKSSLRDFEFEDISIPCTLYEKFDHYAWTYRSESKTYDYTEIGHGGSGAGPIDSQITKKNKENGLYVISYKYLWESYGEFEEELNVYTKFEDAMSSRNPLVTVSRDINKETLIETQASNILNTLDTYTFTFELIDNKIILKDFVRN